MATVWSRYVSGTHYEVRSAGNSLRLYTDGVFHSQYNPKQILTGHVWDLLLLPAFFYPKKKIKRILVMGVAGGAVLHMLRHFFTPDVIVGIELNPVHVSIGKRFFGLNKSPIELIEADAINWLKNYRGEKFDIIIDDLFAEKDGEPVPVIEANHKWFNIMLKNLVNDGVIVRNFINRQELSESAGLIHKSTSKKFHSVFQFNSCFNENFVAAYLRKPATSQQLRKHLVNTPGLNPSLKTSRLRYRIRQLV